ncbi:MAG TPA: TfoX/Sxy family protein [Actinomycetota bacterium]
MAYDEDLAARVRDVLAEVDGSTDEREMFGGIAFMVGGHMCCGVTAEDLMLRLGPDRAEEALDEPHVRPMDFTGRPMKGYVYVSAKGLETEEDLARWIGLARAFVAELPPKGR